MGRERGNIITRLIDKVDAVVLNRRAVAEAQRIREGIELLSRKTNPGIERKDIPELLGIFADKDGGNLGVIERSPNEVSTVINGERVLVVGIGNENGELRVSFDDSQEDVVHNPNLVGDILMRRMAERKRENLVHRK